MCHFIINDLIRSAFILSWRPCACTHAHMVQAHFSQSKAKFTFDQVGQNSVYETTVLHPPESQAVWTVLICLDLTSSEVLSLCEISKYCCISRHSCWPSGDTHMLVKSVCIECFQQNLQKRVAQTIIMMWQHRADKSYDNVFYLCKFQGYDLENSVLTFLWTCFAPAKQLT